jgi:hypothetical protein
MTQSLASLRRRVRGDLSSRQEPTTTTTTTMSGYVLEWEQLTE